MSPSFCRWGKVRGPTHVPTQLLLLPRPPTLNPNGIMIMKMLVLLLSSRSSCSKFPTEIRRCFAITLTLDVWLRLSFHFKDGKLKKSWQIKKTRSPLFAQDSSFTISQTWLRARMITWLGFKFIISLLNQSRGLARLETVCSWIVRGLFVSVCLFSQRLCYTSGLETVDPISARSLIHPQCGQRRACTWQYLGGWYYGCFPGITPNITYQNRSQK